MTRPTSLAVRAGVRTGCVGTALAGLLMMAAPVWAGGAPEVCVHDDNGFAAAAVEAEFAPLKIKLVQGTYHLDSTAFAAGGPIPTFQAFSLLGGYTANCASRNIDPDNTFLTNHAGSQGVFFAYVIGDVTIEGIHFAAPGNGVALNWEDYDHDIPDSVRLTVRRSVFSGGSNTLDIYWDAHDSQTFSARLVDNLVHDVGGNGSCAVDLTATDDDADATFVLINNTIVDNASGDGGGVCIDLSAAGNGGSLFAYNNILYGNAGHDLASAVSALVLVDNVIGTHSYPTPIVPPVGTSTGNPELDANFRPIESPPSPVINSGSNTAPGGLPSSDLDGGPRIVGATVDRGAYESGIDDAFIQSVTNANDSGAGSLRSAIAGANANGSGLITFAIGSSCGPHVITLNSPLPAISVPIFMNAYTQPGASENTLDTGDDAPLCAILESGNSGVTTGLLVASNAGDGAALTVKGLGFSGFSSAAVDLQGGSGHFLGGNHFGGNIGGRALQPNGIDIRLGTAAHDAMIGSDDVADRNIIGDATGSGIVLQGGGSPPLVIGTYNNQILNNYIGVGWSVTGGSYTNRGNGTRGIHMLGHDNTLSGNLIGDNLQAGILIDGDGATNNVIGGNFIGASAGGTVLGNGNAGIHFAGGTGNAPSDNTVRYNTIANNGDEGVWVEIGQGNKIRKNSIYANALLGIDLAGEGVLPNDDDSAIQQNDYANRGQNFPVLTSAAGGSNRGTVSGTLTTTAGDYTVDVYVGGACDGSGYGEGAAWRKSATVSVSAPPGSQGTASFDIAITIAPPSFFVSGEAITATVTDAAGNTSEFSACHSYFNDTIFANGFEPPPA